MKKVLAILVTVASVALATTTCNYDRAVLNFEKRMDMTGVMKGAKVSKELASEPGESSRIQKFSKPIKSGPYMGLRQYAVYGFVGCDLLMVRMGKVNPEDGETAAEATVYLRGDGKLKASCKGKGGVLRFSPFSMSMEPNPECICYDRNGLEKAPGRKTGCAEMEDFDKNAVTLASDYLNFVNPEEKKIDISGSAVQLDERDSYFSERSTGTRTPKNVFTTVKKNLKKLSSAAVGASGKVTLFVKIAQSGEVLSASVRSSTLDDRSAGDRIRDDVATWKFGKSGSGDVEVFLVFKVSLPN